MANEEILELQISDNSSIAAAGLDKLSTSLSRLKAAVGKGMSLKGTTNGIEKLKTAINQGLDDSSIAKWEKLADTLERLKAIGGLKIAGIKNISNQLSVADSLSDAKEAVQDTTNEIANAVDMGMKTVEGAGRTSAGTFSGVWESAKEHLQDVWNRLTDVKEESNKGGSTKFFDSLKDGIRGASESAKELLNDFKRIVKYRMIRSIIKQITSGFSEGVKNLYFYSKMVGTEFYPSMNDAASVLLQFKNSVGAAAAPLIQSLIPYMKMLINYAIEAVNYVNQFLALLRGQTTWTRALYKSTDAFEETGKKAKGSAKAIKELLADWDELNIIQSESGGGSGGVGKKAEDYSKMFEETSDFNKSLKDHFEGVLDIVKKIGLLIGAWKFSKLFTGVVSKLAKFVAGGLMIDIGLNLSYDAGFDMGLNGFSAKNIIEGIVGTLATAVGGSIITAGLGLGGGLGFAIGIGVALIATIKGYIEGQKDLQDRNKWGNLVLTRDQVERFVKSQFTFDVDAKISILDGVITNETEAKKNLDDKITSFKDDLQDATIQAGISVDSSETGATVTKAAESAREAIKAVEGLMDANKDGLKILIKEFKFTDSAGNDISEDLLSNVTIADNTVKSYFTDMGEQLAGWIKEGEEKGWSEGITEAALALMARQQKILEKAEQMKNELDFSTKMDASFKRAGISRDTAYEELEYQKEEIQNYTDKAKEALNTKYETLIYMAGLAQAQADDAFEQATNAFFNGDTEQYDYYMSQRDSLLNAVDKYTTDAKAVLAEIDEVEENLADTKKNMALQWADILKELYGSDFDLSSGIYYELQKRINAGDTAGASDLLYDMVSQTMGVRDPNGIVKYVLDELDGNVYDLLSEGSKELLFKRLNELTGDPAETSRIIQDAFGLVFDDIGDAYKKYWQDPDTIVEDPYAGITDWIEEDYDIGDDGVAVKVKVTLTPADEDLYEDITDWVEEWYDIGDDGVAVKITPVIDPISEEQAREDMGKILQTYNGLMGLTGRAGFTAPNGFTTGAQRESNEELAGKMAAGVKEANAPQNDLLRSMVNYLNTISQKDTTVTVNLVPNSDWGRHNAKSNDSYEKMTGHG